MRGYPDVAKWTDFYNTRTRQRNALADLLREYRALIDNLGMTESTMPIRTGHAYRRIVVEFMDRAAALAEKEKA